MAIWDIEETPQIFCFVQKGLEGKRQKGPLNKICPRSAEYPMSPLVVCWPSTCL